MRLKIILWKIYFQTAKRLEIIRYRTKNYISSVSVWMSGWFKKQYVDIEKLSKADNLIICAHPDDETIFFYSVMKKNTFVVCMSNRGNECRKKEFYDALEFQGACGVMLNFPDIKGLEWAWGRFFAKKELKRIKKIVKKNCKIHTHNIEGESGHKQHYATGRTVRSIFDGYDVYFTAKEALSELELSKEDIDRKKEIMNRMYSSQIKMLTMWCPWYDSYMKIDSFLTEGRMLGE